MQWHHTGAGVSLIFAGTEAPASVGAQHQHRGQNTQLSLLHVIMQLADMGRPCACTCSQRASPEEVDQLAQELPGAGHAQLSRLQAGGQCAGCDSVCTQRIGSVTL